MLTLLKNYIFDLFLREIYENISNFKIKMINLELLIVNMYKITGDLDLITYDLTQKNDLLEKENIFLKNKIANLESSIQKNQNLFSLKNKNIARFHPYNLRKKNLYVK